MNDRIDRDNLNLDIARLIAKRGTCWRMQVGAVITRNGRIISSGYNGSLLEGDCSNIGCDLNSACLHAVHAEANAISFAANQGLALEGTTLYCTHQPCYDCAKLIIQSGIIKVIYSEPYRLNEGLQLLNSKDIEVIQITNG